MYMKSLFLFVFVFSNVMNFVWLLLLGYRSRASLLPMFDIACGD